MIVTIGRIAITLLVALSYPLQCHPCRASLEKIATTVCHLGQRRAQLRHFCTTLLFLIGTYTIALHVTNLDKVKPI